RSSFATLGKTLGGGPQQNNDGHQPEKIAKTEPHISPFPSIRVSNFAILPRLVNFCSRLVRRTQGTHRAGGSFWSGLCLKSQGEAEVQMSTFHDIVKNIRQLRLQHPFNVELERILQDGNGI